MFDKIPVIPNSEARIQVGQEGRLFGFWCFGVCACLYACVYADAQVCKCLKIRDWSWLSSSMALHLGF